MNRLKAKNIEVFATSTDNVEQAVEEYRNRQGKSMAEPHLCTGHHHH